MQRAISDEMHLFKTASPFDCIENIQTIDRTSSDFDNGNEKVHKIKRIIKKGKYDEDIVRYIPKTLKLMFQGMIDKLNILEQPAHLSYEDKENLRLQILLMENHYANLYGFHICFPIKFFAFQTQT